MLRLRVVLLLGLSTTATFGCSHDRPLPSPSGKAHLPAASVSSAPLIYVTDEPGGVVAVVDPALAQVVARIVVGKRPRDVLLSADGKLLYAALSGSSAANLDPRSDSTAGADRSADGVAVVDTAQRKLVRVIPSGRAPHNLAASPDGRHLYVSNEQSAELTALALPSGTIEGVAHVGEGPAGVAVGPEGRLIYVACQGEDQVTVIDVATLGVVGRMQTGKRPRSIVLAKDGRTAFVTNEGEKSVSVLDTAARQAVARIGVYQDSPMPSGVRPTGALLSTDGRTLYVSTGAGGSLAIIDVTLRKQVRSIDGIGDQPAGMGLDATGTFLYSSNGSSTDLSIVNLGTGNVDQRVHIGGSPVGLAVAH